MKILTAVGRIFFCLGVIGLGAMQFYYGAFRPVFVPQWPTWLPGLRPFAYLGSALFIFLSLCILLDKNARKCALLLGGFFLILDLIFQLPFMLFVSQYPWRLGSWVDFLKVLAMAGSAFVVAGSFSAQVKTGVSDFRSLSVFIPAGKIFFAFMMMIFGIDHFLYTEFVASLVPDWIPGHVFWADFAGVALIGTGVAIILNIKRRQVSMLAGIMLLLWVIVLHIPRTYGHPEIADKANEVTSVFEALAFSGIAFLIALEGRTGRLGVPNTETSDRMATGKAAS